LNKKGYQIIKSIKSMILMRIKDHPQGWVFTAYDFIHEFNRGEIDDSLSTLTEEGEIRRLMRGIYEYPIYDELQKTYEPPNIDQAAKALARKFSWKIYPDASAVLQNLGLSEYAVQVPEKNIYLSDGPNKKYIIGNHCIEFKHISLKETSLKYEHTVKLVLAIKAVGRNQITPEFLNKLKEKFTYTEWTQIKTDAVNSIGWVYDIIRDLCNQIFLANINNVIPNQAVKLNT